MMVMPFTCARTSSRRLTLLKVFSAVAIASCEMPQPAAKAAAAVAFDAGAPMVEVRPGLAAAAILGRSGLSLADIDRFACHPGGSKVIVALERALSLEQGVLDHERSVLADYGNMSAPTALFVLERLIGAGLPPRTLLTAMGPGFTSSCVSLQRAA